MGALCKHKSLPLQTIVIIDKIHFSYSLQAFASPGLTTGVITLACSSIPIVSLSLQAPAGREDSPAVGLQGWIPLACSALTEGLELSFQELALESPDEAEGHC